MPLWITLDQLQVGLYVQLDLRWVEHPFGFNSFKIKSAEQIGVLRQLGLEKIRYDPNRSSVKPLLPSARPAPPPVACISRDDPLIQAKRARVAFLREYQHGVARAENALRKAAETLRNINIKLTNRPMEARAEAEVLIDQMTATFLVDPDVTIHAMGGTASCDDLYHHGLNVALLSLIMAKGLGLSSEEGKILGMGALFHDVGLREVPSLILRKREPLTAAEYRLRQMHCEYGVEIGKRLGLPNSVLDIIAQHHELVDGSGYPGRLKGEAIAPLARLVQVANRYDSLCNPIEPGKAMSPHEALAYMFAQQRAKHDPDMMRMLIRCLGVYPPGTAVHLSNGATALVTSVNPMRPLKPTLVVYEPDVPREEAIVLDLSQETDIHISSGIQPGQLPRAICDYLCMRKHVSYYFGQGDTGTA
jgi:putative nucleotidyltransferase with HDIG domain